MTDALRQAGAMRGTKVVDMTCEPVGNGLVGDSYRLGLAYEEVEPDAPASVIGKFPAADPDSRRSGSAHLLYLREVSFYRELAHTLPINTPRPFVAQIDPETDDFILIREDLAGGSARRLFTRRRQDRAGGGCGVARLRWGDPALQSLDWLAARPTRPLGALSGGRTGRFKVFVGHTMQIPPPPRFVPLAGSIHFRGQPNPDLIPAAVGAYSENGPVGAAINPRRVRLIARRRQRLDASHPIRAQSPTDRARIH